MSRLLLRLHLLIEEIWSNEGRPQAMSLLDLWRAAIHFPVGCFAAWLISVFPAIGIVFSVGFLTYEIMEDLRIEDRSYKDIFGYLVGIAVATVIIYI